MLMAAQEKLTDINNISISTVFWATEHSGSFNSIVTPFTKRTKGKKRMSSDFCGHSEFRHGSVVLLIC